METNDDEEAEEAEEARDEVTGVDDEEDGEVEFGEDRKEGVIEAIRAEIDGLGWLGGVASTRRGSYTESTGVTG